MHMVLRIYTFQKVFFSYLSILKFVKKNVTRQSSP